MKIDTIKVILIFILLFVTGCATHRHATLESQRWNYEIEPMHTGVKGTYQVKVWSYTSNPSHITELARVNAVHAIIFNGYAGNANLTGNQPLVLNPETKIMHKEFFDNFFSPGGRYKDFVELAANGAIGPGDRMKINRRTYKIGIVASVKAADLRKELESKGIIRSMEQGF